MDIRRGNILSAAVREFIQAGEPISSGLLYRRYQFGIKPAMIRAEMNALTESRFLEQPHHSSGRIPTDLGYEFFVRHILEEDAPIHHLDRPLAQFLREREFSELIGRLSENLGLLGVVREFKHGDVYKDGLKNLIDHLVWESVDEVKSVIRDFEEIDARLEHPERVVENDGIRVFIGKKSPITRSACLSVIAGEYDVRGARFLLIGIGPKRMDYEKSVNTFKGLRSTTAKKHGRKK